MKTFLYPMNTHSNQSDPQLTVIDVGHGSAAVLQYEGIITIFDAGRRGQYLRRYLIDKQILAIDTLIISHADEDHSGGLITILLDKSIQVKRLFINPDPTKRTNTHEQLQYAIQEARLHRGTIIETHVSTSLNGKLDKKNLRIEVLYPTPEVVVSDVGGQDLEGKPNSSNSMCAAIRLVFKDEPKVLLGGDIDFSCLNYWIEHEIDSDAEVLVFPHHGGMPDTSSRKKTEMFAKQIADLVSPKYVIFSIHKTKYSLPRQEILSSLMKVISDPYFLCTQLPQEYVEIVLSENPGHWKMHCIEKEGDREYAEGNIRIDISEKKCLLAFEI